MFPCVVTISDFSNADVEHDLSLLIGEENLNLHPDVLAKRQALKAAGVLVSVIAPFPLDAVGIALNDRCVHRSLRYPVLHNEQLHAFG